MIKVDNHFSMLLSPIFARLQYLRKNLNEEKR